MTRHWPARFDVYTALCGVVAFAMFVAMAYLAHVYARFPGDLEITRAVQLLRSPAFDTISGALRWTGLPPQSQYVYGACAVLLLMFKKPWAAAVIAVSAAGSTVLYFFVEPRVSRPRPDENLVYVAGKLNMGSFPSGHVLIALSVYGFRILSPRPVSARPCGGPSPFFRRWRCSLRSPFPASTTASTGRATSPAERCLEPPG
jgi:membrane-associated phospholipid phosphatase